MIAVQNPPIYTDNGAAGYEIIVDDSAAGGDWAVNDGALVKRLNANVLARKGWKNLLTDAFEYEACIGVDAEGFVDDCVAGKSEEGTGVGGGRYLQVG